MLFFSLRLQFAYFPKRCDETEKYSILFKFYLSDHLQLRFLYNLTNSSATHIIWIKSNHYLCNAEIVPDRCSLYIRVETETHEEENLLGK